MKSNKSIIFIGVFFIALMIGAYILYTGLSGSFESDRLSVVETEKTKTSDYSDTSSDGEEAEKSQEQTSSDESSEETQLYPAPEFYVFDSENQKVNFSDLKGKPIVLNFWASWCGPCKMEMKHFEQAYGTYGEDIEFMLVNMTDGNRETVEKASKFIADGEYTFPVYFDTEFSAAYTYGASVLPVTYFIDAEGNLIASCKGALDMDIMKQGIDMIMPEK